MYELFNWREMFVNEYKKTPDLSLPKVSFKMFFWRLMYPFSKTKIIGNKKVTENNDRSLKENRSNSNMFCKHKNDKSSKLQTTRDDINLFYMQHHKFVQFNCKVL